MKLFNLELKRILKNHYIGFIALFVISVILISLYNAIYYNSENVNILINKVDSRVLKMLDINKDKFITLDGYFIFIVKILEIIFSAYAINLGISIASYDKKTNTRTFLYSKPKKRNQTIINRIIASSIFLLIEVFIICITSVILFVIFNKSFNLFIIFLVLLSMYLVLLVFFSLGLVIGGFKGEKTPNMIVSIITTIIFTAIHILDIFFNIKFLYYLNPFSYFNINEISNGANFPLSALLASLFMLVFLISFGISIYEANNEKSDKI